MSNTGRRLLTVQVASQESGIPNKTLYCFIAEGRIPGVLRVGRKLLISRTVWDRFLDGEMPRATVTDRSRQSPS